jgi:protoporphyrinogen oxidase
VKKLVVQEERVRKLKVQSGEGVEEIEPDYVVCTLPIPELVSISDGLPKNFLDSLKKVKYKSTISGVIALDRRITDYYWINLLDCPELKTGGVFNHTILNPYVNGGNSLLYVFTYVDSSDKLWSMSERELTNVYIRELEGIFKGVGTSVAWSRVFKLEYSKPVYDVGYKTYRPQTTTPVKNLFLAGIGLFPQIRNMGNAMETGFNAAEACMRAIENG